MKLFCWCLVLIVLLGLGEAKNRIDESVATLLQTNAAGRAADGATASDVSAEASESAGNADSSTPAGMESTLAAGVVTDDVSTAQANAAVSTLTFLGKATTAPLGPPAKGDSGVPKATTILNFQPASSSTPISLADVKTSAASSYSANSLSSSAAATSTSIGTTTTTKPPIKSTPADGSIQSATNCKNRKYFFSKINATRNEAGLRCKSMDMTLLTVTAIEELACLSGLSAGTFWTSGSNEGVYCDAEKRYAWCSTGHDVSQSLTSSAAFWLPTNNTPTALERCLAVVISPTAGKQGMLHRDCADQLPFICQFSVDCPKQCSKNVSLFDPTGNLLDKKAYGVWFDIGDYTYLLGNKPMTWFDNWQQCCALGMEALNIANQIEQQGLTNLTVEFKGSWTANFNYWTSGTWKGAPVDQWSWCKPSGPMVLTPGLKWEAGQPDNKGGNESCVHFRFVLNDTGTILTDRNCTSRYIFACKMARRTTVKPCVASCPGNKCERNASLFDGSNTLKDYMSYGDWYDGCGRNFLVSSEMLNWKAARDRCCSIGLTLGSMESAGKSGCFSKIVAKYAPSTFGDFWLSGTDLDCDSKFRWCSLGRDFVDSEVKWMPGHPKSGLDCVYVEAKNGSTLLATASCAEQKFPLCEVRKKGTSRRAMQTECAEIWNITSDQIDLLLNVSAFLTTTVPLNLKCFLKCVGVEVGMFGLNGLNSIATLREIELVSQEEPSKMEQGFVAYDDCSSQRFDDECVTAYETYKCGQQKAPDLVSKIITNNFDNSTIFYPPTPCVTMRRTCWISENYPCEINQTAVDEMNNGTPNPNGVWKTSGNRSYFVTNVDPYAKVVPGAAYKFCCSLGLKLLEPENLAEIGLALSFYTPSTMYNLVVGDTEFVNGTHEVWCRSRKVLTDDMYDTTVSFYPRYACHSTVVILFASTGKLRMLNENGDTGDIVDIYVNPQKHVSSSFPNNYFNSYICVKP